MFGSVFEKENLIYKCRVDFMQANLCISFIINNVLKIGSL